VNGQSWPAFDQVLATLSTAPARTGSVIVTVYGDAILPRGGALALADLLALMERLGAPGGVVRTAVSRLAKDGLIEGRRVGRRSAYALTARGTAEFRAATQQIYGTSLPGWDGRLRLAFPEPGTDRTALERAGFALLAPGILLSPHQAPAGTSWLQADGAPETMQRLAARAWPLDRLADLYTTFSETFRPLQPVPSIASIDAMAVRIMLIHAWRRIALRDPHLPPALLPEQWPGFQARTLCVDLYTALAPASEHWLDQASTGNGPLPLGPDPVTRFHT
jgi:phenylacetic acid degradation operon negative regulatory protein